MCGSCSVECVHVQGNWCSSHRHAANLSALPPEAIAAIRAVLAGKSLVDPAAVLTIVRSLPHGHLVAAAVIAKTLGLAELLGPPSRHRQVAMALILARTVPPASKLATISWWADTTLAADLDVASVSTDEVYAAMDWLLGRQSGIEKKLAARHLAPAVNSSRIAMFDLSSSWVTGRHCELAARGYSRDGKKGCEQIEYGACSPTPTAARSRSGCSRAIPPTRPRSPTRSPLSRTPSGWST